MLKIGKNKAISLIYLLITLSILSLVYTSYSGYIIYRNKIRNLKIYKMYESNLKFRLIKKEKKLLNKSKNNFSYFNEYNFEKLIYKDYLTKSKGDYYIISINDIDAKELLPLSKDEKYKNLYVIYKKNILNENIYLKEIIQTITVDGKYYHKTIKIEILEHK